MRSVRTFRLVDYGLLRWLHSQRGGACSFRRRPLLRRERPGDLGERTIGPLCLWQADQVPQKRPIAVLEAVDYRSAAKGGAMRDEQRGHFGGIGIIA